MISTSVTDVLSEIRSKGSDYGRCNTFEGQSALIEFVSANPHGPITVDNGRCGVVGDVLSKLLEAVGYKVTKEYYVNDVLNGVQLENLGRSLEVRYLQALGHDKQLSDDGYQGDYVTEIARRIVERDGDRHVHLPRDQRVKLFTEIGKTEMLERHKADLHELGIRFDSWYSESDLFASGKVTEALNELEKRDYAYSSGDALWLKSTAFGDEIDRPLVRSSGQATYIASDAAYHKDKFDRGFDRLINVWGAQHEMYVVRARAAIQALGYDTGKLDILIHQNVKLFSGGEQVMMAKRRGEFVALNGLIEEVGADATRFFLLFGRLDQPLDFDLDLARVESNDNPLHSLLQAYHVAVDVLQAAEHKGMKTASVINVDLSQYDSTSEVNLINKLGDYPDVVKDAAAGYKPHRLISYAAELAGAFHAYTEHTADNGVDNRKLILVDCSLTVIKSICCMLGLLNT